MSSISARSARPTVPAGSPFARRISPSPRAPAAWRSPQRAHRRTARAKARTMTGSRHRTSRRPASRIVSPETPPRRFGLVVLHSAGANALCEIHRHRRRATALDRLARARVFVVVFGIFSASIRMIRRGPRFGRAVARCALASARARSRGAGRRDPIRRRGSRSRPERLLRHRRALDMPARPAGAPRRRPARVLTRLLRLPQREIHGVALEMQPPRLPPPSSWSSWRWESSP